MNLDEALEQTAIIIDRYESGEWLSVDNLRELLRGLTKCHYVLTKENIESYRRHNAILFNFEGSVARGQIEADEQEPNLRLTRKLIESVDHVLWSMRSEISILKKEE